MSDEESWRRFEAVALPHLDAAYNLARWLTRNDHDAEDVVQESLVRAMRYLGGFRGEGARPWLLQIVRNTCFSWLRLNRPGELQSLDASAEMGVEPVAPAADEPHVAALRRADREQVNRALAGLPVAFREVLVLRELEELSYKEIADITDAPVGTVMSRLARARGLMRLALAPGAPVALRAVGRAGHER